MPSTHKPRDGSLQFWPRKRARRIYPSIKHYPDVKEPKPLAFAGYKAGMTTVFITDNKKGSPTQGQTISQAVTVIEVPPLFVLGLRAYSSDNLPITEVYAKEIPKKLKKYIKAPKGVKKSKTKNLKDVKNIGKVRLIVSTQPKNTGLGKKTPEILEIEIGGSLEEQIENGEKLLGKEINIDDVFKEGDFVDVIAITKGKGFQGVVKRFGVKIRGRKDEEHHRQIGIMAPEGLARVPYTTPQAGQMGFQRRTEFNKQIYKIGEKPEEVNPDGGFVRYGEVKGKYILLKGSVPGPKKRMIILRTPIRSYKKGYPIDISHVSRLSQQ
ncbi:MAG: 50S ribosomal protein L3 [Candidatus Aenigmarchaeota archaeon]|nr:50S ribosomal protein L3 [Candidatus Aenigmarchaeota archaeon]